MPFHAEIESLTSFKRVTALILSMESELILIQNSIDAVKIQGEVDDYEYISYRGLDFTVKQLVEMRKIIYMKMLQSIRKTPAFNECPPSKIGSDLV
jgi:hypothetical protein